MITKVQPAAYNAVYPMRCLMKTKFLDLTCPSPGLASGSTNESYNYNKKTRKIFVLTRAYIPTVECGMENISSYVPFSYRKHLENLSIFIGF